MIDGSTHMLFYTSHLPYKSRQIVYTACEDAGFGVQPDTERTNPMGDTPYEETTMEYEAGEFDLKYHPERFGLVFSVDADRPPVEPSFSIGCNAIIYPSEFVDPADYPMVMDGLFELLCRISVALDVDYAPLVHTTSRGGSAMPQGRPIGEVVEQVPRMGVYSAAVLEQFGGIKALGTPSVWYTADLDGGLTIVIESAEPWLNGGWQPPTEAPYLSNAAFADPDPDPEPESESAGIDLSDPFAALAPGEHGTELGITREEIGKDFTNENIRLVRVYVGDNGDLRRIEDDSFVRKIIADGPDDRVAFIQRTLSDVPPDAREDQQVVSALLNDAIPPSFVQLDGPDGENVVTKVMALDVETNKYALLCSLGRDAQHDDFTAEDREAMETALENLAGLGDVEGIEEYIETNLL